MRLSNWASGAASARRWDAAPLASVAIVEYARAGTADAALAEKLQNLVRAAVRHWWEFARLHPARAGKSPPSSYNDPSERQA